MIKGIHINQVYLVSGITDMRKAINGLSLILSEQLGHDPFDGSAFVFCNRQQNFQIATIENHQYCSKYKKYCRKSCNVRILII